MDLRSFLEFLWLLDYDVIMRKTDLEGNLLPETEVLEVSGPNPGRYLKSALESEIEASLEQRGFERRMILPRVNQWVMDLFDEPNDKENMAAKTRIASQILSGHSFTMPTVNLQVASEEARRAKEEASVKTIEVREVSGEELVSKMMEAFKADEASREWRELERRRRGIDAPNDDEAGVEGIGGRHYDADGGGDGS